MKIHLSLIRCKYCGHANSADAKFCNACGGKLHLPAHLTSCLRCGTVNPVKATECSWCRSPLPEHKPGAPVPASPVKVSFLPGRISGAIAGAVGLAVIGAIAYFSFRQDSPVDVPRPAAEDTSSASANPLATPARAATNEPRTDRPPVESQQGRAAGAASARSQPVGAGRPVEPVPPRGEACTEGLAALGLCAPRTTQRGE